MRVVNATMRSRSLEQRLTLVGCALGVALLFAAWRGCVEFDVQEAFGFVTGAACVWLGVKENIWNWPIGLANNILYVFIFGHARLFADASLQVAFGVLGAYGWFVWSQRGPDARRVPVSRTPATVWLATAIGVAIMTVGLMRFLVSVRDAAPLLDALTTTLSLGAQYLMTRKYVECWWMWIAVDAISIGLYAVKHLELTALLYAVYLVMCIVGLRDWSASLAAWQRAVVDA